jgi:hypothetical protein
MGARMQASWRLHREPNYILGIAVPTDGIRAASRGTGDFGTSPIFGQLSGKPLLASTKHLGCRDVKHNDV